MRCLLDLSFRYKLPFWGTLLIVVSTLTVSAALMVRAYGDLKTAMVIGAQGMGRTMAVNLFPAILHDDTWRAFEIVSAPFHDNDADSPVRARAVFVLDRNGQIVVSSHPDDLPMLSSMRTLGHDYARLASALATGPERLSRVVEPAGSDQLFFTLPIVERDAWVGTLVLVYAKSEFLAWFLDSALGGALIGLLVLTVLLPINWYWGRRMAEPLVRLARRMDDIQQRPPEHPESELYPCHDELGHLFEAYNRMVETLREKAALEQGIVKDERLTALGRLSSGIAHEINNPLAGMLTAIDTLRQRDNMDVRDQRTLGLLERGLMQIRDTVAALLVEARPQSRDLEFSDLEDVYTLIAPAAAKRGVRLACAPELDTPVPIPAGFVRQILVNLLLNAVQAAPEGGQVEGVVRREAGELLIEVSNTGPPIPPAIMEHLYEPFSSGREGGHGLGLWVTYQIVSQLGGTLSAVNLPDGVRFSIRLPLGEPV